MKEFASKLFIDVDENDDKEIDLFSKHGAEHLKSNNVTDIVEISSEITVEENTTTQDSLCIYSL